MESGLESLIALFDSNILIDVLNNIEPATKEIERHNTREISIVTWMEVLGAHRRSPKPWSESS